MAVGLKIIITINLFLFCSEAKLLPLIGGGEYSFIKQFPHSVLLRIYCNNANNLDRCGASIISQDILLSAAKCFLFCKKPYTIMASMGNEREGLGQIRRVIDFIIHENFKEYMLTNDIALAMVDSPIKFGMNVRRVVLVKTPPFYEPAFIAGWGWRNNQREPSIYLKHTSQYLADIRDCIRDLKPGRIANGTFCMENRFRNSRAFEGDTGSALVVKGYIQVGIISWGDINFSYSKMIYTNTSYFLEWITKRSLDLYCRNRE